MTLEGGAVAGRHGSGYEQSGACVLGDRSGPVSVFHVEDASSLLHSFNQLMVLPNSSSPKLAPGELLQGLFGDAE